MMTKLMPKIGQRTPLITGPVLITGALVWLSAVAPGTSYLTGLLGPMLLYGIGTGMIFMPLTMIGVSAVAVSDTGAVTTLTHRCSTTAAPGKITWWSLTQPTRRST
jgi:hypothetical protein